MGFTPENTVLHTLTEGTTSSALIAEQSTEINLTTMPTQDILALAQRSPESAAMIMSLINELQGKERHNLIFALATLARKPQPAVEELN